MVVNARYTTARTPVAGRNAPVTPLNRKPRNDTRQPAVPHCGGPAWCTADHTQTGRHRSNPVDVGDRREGGAVRAWLVQDGDQETRVVVNAATMTGVAVIIDLDDAVELRNGLTRLFWRAGRD